MMTFADKRNRDLGRCHQQATNPVEINFLTGKRLLRKDVLLAKLKTLFF